MLKVYSWGKKVYWKLGKYNPKALKKKKKLVFSQF